MHVFSLIVDTTADVIVLAGTAMLLVEVFKALLWLLGKLRWHRMLARTARNYEKIRAMSDPNNRGEHLHTCEILWATKAKVGIK